MSNSGGGEADVTGARGYGNVGGSFGINMPGLDQTTQQLAKLNAALSGLQTTMNKIQSSAVVFTNAVSGITKIIASMSAAGGGSCISNGGVSSRDLSDALYGTSGGGLAKNLALFPARYIQGQVQANRNVVNTAGAALGLQSFGSSTNLQGMLGSMSKQMGGVMSGNPADLVALMQVAQRAGAGIDWRSPSQSTSPRAAGFLESVRQGQLMNPGADVSSIGASVGGFLGNVGAQQTGAFLTGGAFSMIGSGNKVKSISDWAEGILKWFMNQRPGSKRGKPFDYGELMSQNFPGSNMDAWFSTNGVPQDMRDYFWSYALGKASSTGTTGGAAILQQGQTVGAPTQQNPIYQRLAAGNAATRQSFNLGGKLTGMYGNMEQSNRWFNELMGQMQGQILPGALASGPLSFMQYLPDQMRNLLMQLAERTDIGAAGAGILGWGSMIPGLTPGDVGDVGDYGSFGTSGLAGMHPDMRKKVGAMMRANPNLSITSGHRDLAKQQTLKRRGVGRVSGKPSAHTRGMAADLGPASQYGWISANAGKFGLKSGVGAGEPWHVGMGDTEGGVLGGLGGLGASLGAIDPSGMLSMIQGLFSGLSGALGAATDPQNQMQGIATGTTGIMKVLLSLFAQPNADLSSLDFRDVYGSMVGYTKGALFNKNLGLPTGGASNGGTTAGSTSGGNWAAGSVAKGDFASPDPLTRAKAVAQAASQAGFSGNDLFEILSITGRESNWRPGAYNPNAATKDLSYGLAQINMLGNLGPARRKQFGIAANEDLYDPYVNMRAAYSMFQGGGFNAWGPYKGVSELHDTESKQPIAREALKELNLGAVDYAAPATTMAGGRSVNVFNNTIRIEAGALSNGGGGIDVRRTASRLVDEMEGQMRARASRND